jgi:hypothetical protein
MSTVVVLAVSAVLAVGVGRWWVLVVPLVGVPLNAALLGGIDGAADAARATVFTLAVVAVCAALVAGRELARPG